MYEVIEDIVCNWDQLFICYCNIMVKTSIIKSYKLLSFHLIYTKSLMHSYPSVFKGANNN